jgi:hypothetical protein
MLRRERPHQSRDALLRGLCSVAASSNGANFPALFRRAAEFAWSEATLRPCESPPGLAGALRQPEIAKLDGQKAVRSSSHRDAICCATRAPTFNRRYGNAEAWCSDGQRLLPRMRFAVHCHAMQIVQRDRAITVVFEVQRVRRCRQKDGVPEFPFSSTCSIRILNFFAQNVAR